MFQFRGSYESVPNALARRGIRRSQANYRPNATQIRFKRSNGHKYKYVTSSGLYLAYLGLTGGLIGAQS